MLKKKKKLILLQNTLKNKTPLVYLPTKPTISLGLVYQKFKNFTKIKKKNYIFYLNKKIKEKKIINSLNVSKIFKITQKNNFLKIRKNIYKKDPLFRLNLFEKFLTLFLRKGNKIKAFLVFYQVMKIIKYVFYLAPMLTFLFLLHQYKPSFFIGGFRKGKKSVSIPIGLYRDTQYIFSLLYFFKAVSSYTKEKTLFERLEKELFLLFKLPKQSKLVISLNEHYQKVFDTIRNVNYKW